MNPNERGRREALKSDIFVYRRLNDTLELCSKLNDFYALIETSGASDRFPRFLEDFERIRLHMACISD